MFRDVAKAHVLAMENPAITGRYCLGVTSLSVDAILQIISQQFPQLKVPTATVSYFSFITWYNCYDESIGEQSDGTHRLFLAEEW